MHFMKIEKWFLILLKLEHLHYHQLKAQDLLQTSLRVSEY